MAATATYPHRVVRLTGESTETPHQPGEDARIVVIPGLTVRPPRARTEEPRMPAFITARLRRIQELAPDLIPGISDLQAVSRRP